MMNYLYLLTIMLILIFMIIINMMLSMIKNNNREKKLPFECGFNPQSNSRLPFSNNFFLITLLFLIFDIEIILIIPSIFLIKSFNSLYLSILMFLFIMLLIFSLMYEWIYNMLNWIF